MLIRNTKIDKPVKVTVGDVVFYVFRIGERAAKIGVDAPEGIKIEIEQDTGDRMPRP